MSPPDRPIPALLEQFGLFKRSRWHGSATQRLWSKLESTGTLLELCKAREDLTIQDCIILEQCGQQLEVARRCIDKPVGRWSFAFWEAIHEADGLLLLVMPQQMLLPKALEIQEQFQRKVADASKCKLWLWRDDAGAHGPLAHCVCTLGELSEAGGAPITDSPQDCAKLEHCRYVLRGALAIVNQQVDTTFWQLSINALVQVLSTVLLIVLFLVAFLVFHEDMIESWPNHLIPHGMLILILAGAAGAVLSNMLSKERFAVSTGATVRYFGYYLLAKPAVGGFAALTLLFLERSNLLLAVVVRPPEGATAATSTVDNPAILHIVVNSPQAAFFALAVLAVVAGFSADKLLSSIMDNVLGKLLGQSEKMLPPPAPPAEQQQ